MINGLGRPPEAIVVSGSWPGETTGYEIACRSSLREYCRFFHTVYFFGPDCERFHPDVEWSGCRVEWIPIPFLRGPAWQRFLRSLAGSQPAITVRYRDAISRVCDALAQVATRAFSRHSDLAVIYEDVPAACLIPSMRRQFPLAIQIVRSHNCLVKGFAGLNCQGGILHRIAWNIELRKIRRFEECVCSGTDILWTISAQDAVEYSRRLRVSAHGVLGVSMDAKRYRFVPPGQPATVVHVGSADLRKGKGLLQFIKKGWPRVRAAVADARLVLGGRGTETFSDSNMGIQGLGFVADERDVMAKGPIFINPQQIGSGVKLKSISAMLAGRALVSTTSGIEGIDATDGRHYLLANTPAELANRIVNLIYAPEKAFTIATEARALASRQYSREALSETVQPLLHSLFTNTASRHRIAA